MSLTPGTRLGPYEIVSPLGAGGMGEVYRASDAKLNRDVALKILPELFANDPERRARFAREAKTLASLNHPNIAHVYGLEDRAIVMELVEGPTLAEMIRALAGTKAAGIELSEALPIARQIADALACAHDAGIIHRDLKPANIKVRDDGTVKVLDFGLAKALSPDADNPSAEPANSPTLTNRATALGVILGTAAYMAPEQAKGKAVDRRADVWAFGVVLYQMLTGRRLFEGDDVSETLAAVLTRQPNWHDLPPSTPASVRRLLARCLARDPRVRLDSMASARLDIDEALGIAASASQAAGVSASGAPFVAAPSAPARSPWLALVVVAVVATSLGWLLATWVRPGSAEGAGSSAPIIASLLAPPDAISAFHRGFALSPDGEHLVFSARSADGRRALWKRRLAQSAFERIPGTEDALYPFWSPDGRHIGFFAAGALKRISSGGGPVQTICKAQGSGQKASWGARDEILFSVGRGPFAGVFKVAATGGTPTPVPLEAETFAPEWIAGGPGFLHVRGDADTIQLWAATTDGSQPPRRLLDLEQRDPGFTLAPSGVIFFNRAGVLTAQQIDAASLALAGSAQALGVSAGTPRGWFGASATDDTLLVLGGPTQVTGGNPGDPLSRLRWVDREGRVVGEPGGSGRYWTHRLSPDGRRAVVNPDKDLWIVDTETGMRSRWTEGPATYSGAIWSADGSRLLYRLGPTLWSRPVDAQTAPTEVVTFAGRTLNANDSSLDGKRLLLTGRERGTAKSTDVFLLNVGEADAKPLVATEAQEAHPRFSPNGRWVAYSSDLTGRPEVYLRSTDGDATAVRVSSNGGEHPQFRRDGQELFFLTLTDEIVAVDLSQFEATKVPGAHKALFRLLLNDIIRDLHSPFAVAPDGKRFLVNVPDPSEPLTLIQGFTKLLGSGR